MPPGRQGMCGITYLTIDFVIMKQAEVGNRKLFTAFIDHKRAFDSIPNTWL